MENWEGNKASKYDLEDRLLRFAVEATAVAESLPQTRLGNHVVGQLIRCSTSPMANYAEAQSAESHTDFIHKMKITLKELRETRVWLIFLQRKGLCYRKADLDAGLAEVAQLIAIFVRSLEAAKLNRTVSPAVR